MKITLLLCLIVLMTGCPQPPPKPVVILDMDSPIIVSDGSAKFHGKSAKVSGSDPTVVIEAEPQAQATYLECPSKKGFRCPPIPLASQWKITVYDANNSTIMTLSSVDAANSDVEAKFNVPYTLKQNDTDAQNSGHPYAETNDSTLMPNSFQLVNGTVTYPTYTCIVPGGSVSGNKCRFLIHYQ